MKAIWMIPLLVVALPTFAMDVLDDTQLAQSTGQDGLTLTIQPKSAGQAGLIGFSDFAFIDTNGLTGTTGASIRNAGTATNTSYTGVGSMVVNMRANSGIQLLTSGGVYSTGAITTTIDVDGSAGQGANALLYMSINLPADVVKIKADIQDISLRADTLSGANVVTGSVEKPIAQFSQGIDFNLASQLRLAVVLGAEGTAANLNHFVTLVSANFSSIDLGTVTLPSIGGTANESSLSAKVSLTNLDLSGAYLDVTSTGLTFAKASIGPFNVSISDITAGNTAAAASSTVFNGTNVGSLGTLGANGITVSNFKMTVSGM
jgi:hypothetical protein